MIYDLHARASLIRIFFHQAFSHDSVANRHKDAENVVRNDRFCQKNSREVQLN